MSDKPAEKVKDDGGPAFPVTGIDGVWTGMTLRQYYKGQVVVGLITFENGERLAKLFETIEQRQSRTAYNKQSPMEYFAQIAGELADALVAEDKGK